MNPSRQTVNLLNIFKRLHPSCSWADGHMACYSSTMHASKVAVHYELRFWLHKEKGRLMLNNECVCTPKNIGTEQQALDLIAMLSKNRDEMCATCPSRGNKARCKNACFISELRFDGPHVHFSAQPKELKDFAEVGFFVCEFESLVRELFQDFFIGVEAMLIAGILLNMKGLPSDDMPPPADSGNLN